MDLRKYKNNDGPRRKLTKTSSNTGVVNSDETIKVELLDDLTIGQRLFCEVEDLLGTHTDHPLSVGKKIVTSKITDIQELQGKDVVYTANSVYELEPV